MGETTFQLMQDFFHQQYHLNTNTPTPQRHSVCVSKFVGEQTLDPVFRCKNFKVSAGRKCKAPLCNFQKRKIQNKVESHLKRTGYNLCCEHANSNQPALCINKICARSSPPSPTMKTLTTKTKVQSLGGSINEFDTNPNNAVLRGSPPKLSYICIKFDPPKHEFLILIPVLPKCFQEFFKVGSWWSDVYGPLIHPENQVS